MSIPSYVNYTKLVVVFNWHDYFIFEDNKRIIKIVFICVQSGDNVRLSDGQYLIFDHFPGTD